MTGEARRILVNTGYRVMADAAGKVASLVLYIVMARQLGAAEFGVFAFGLSFVTLVTALANFGQDRILTREVARDHGRVNAYFMNTIVLKLVLALPALVVAVAILTAFADTETRDVVVLLGIAVVLEQLMATCFATFQSYERLAYIPAALVTQRVLTALWAIAAMLSGAGIVAVAAIYLGGAIVGLAIAMWCLLARVARPRLSVWPRMWRGLMLAAFPIGAAGIFMVVLARADMAILAALQSAEDVGEYAAAYRLFEATLFLTWGVSAAVYPVFSRLSLTSTPSVHFVFERGLKLAVALTLPLAVGGAVLAGPLIDLLYGSEFEDSARALVLLSPAIALYPISYLAGYLLVSQDRQRILLPVYACVAVANVLLNLVLIPAFSLYGAAIITSISEAIVAVVLTMFAVRTVGRLDWLRMVGGPAVASLLAGIAMAVLASDLAIAIAAGALAYLGSLFVFERLVYPEDARAIQDLLPGRKVGGRVA